MWFNSKSGLRGNNSIGNSVEKKCMILDGDNDVEYE
jgi:hypothetical protein